MAQATVTMMIRYLMDAHAAKWPLAADGAEVADSRAKAWIMPERVNLVATGVHLILGFAHQLVNEILVRAKTCFKKASGTQ